MSEILLALSAALTLAKQLQEMASKPIEQHTDADRAAIKAAQALAESEWASLAPKVS